jgi:antitoxin ParD1/3/4
VTDAQDDWIKAQVANGDFTNDSEYFRDLIRRDHEKERAVKAAIDKGMARGPSGCGVDAIWAEAEARYLASGG